MHKKVEQAKSYLCIHFTRNMQASQIQHIVSQLNISKVQIENTIKLFEEGGTVPFIARYRKEQTQSLDEVQIQDIKTLIDKFTEADKRRLLIKKSIDEQGKLSNEILQKLNNALFLKDLEDIYLPFKQNRKTRATEAIAKGLEPLAKIIFEQRENNIYSIAEKYVGKNISNVNEAISGARDIIAEWISDDVNVRNRLRAVFEKYGVLSSKVKKNKENEGQKFKDYFDFNETIKTMPSHRYLAIIRGESEGFLKVHIEIETEPAIDIIERMFLKGMPQPKAEVALAIADSLKRLLLPSIENETHKLLKEKADITAIGIFSSNLRQLLLSAPLGQKRVLAVDPGFRTGCKIVALDANGSLLMDDVLYIQSKAQEAEARFRQIIEKYSIEAIAIGNGTASRETEEFVKKQLKVLSKNIKVYMVSEQGASIYSASDVAREEFPNKDLTVRGSISIGRRLMDPLAELVKLDPKSIGVGQYQHDVDQKLLKQSLDNVVVSCVNAVGVELNTASKHLLAYVSGIGPSVAQNIIDYRTQIGKFKERHELKSVPRLGEKVYEQCAGFLRVRESNNILDNTGIHPERYKLVAKMAKSLHMDLKDFIENPAKRKELDLKAFIDGEIGLPTLTDILKELEKPGLDPRESLEDFSFAEIHSISDLKVGMILPGIVTNITAFGCFVDIGVHQDGLVHLSQLANRFIKDPNEVVKVHQKVHVKVTEIEESRKRIALSMKF